MAGQIVDASLVPAPKQRNTDGEKEAIKAGKICQGDLAGRAEQGGAEGHERPSWLRNHGGAGR